MIGWWEEMIRVVGDDMSGGRRRSGWWEMITNLVGVHSANEGQGGVQALFIY